MLLHTFLISPNFRDALLESLSILVIGALAITLMGAYHQNKRRRVSWERTIKDLESSRRTLNEVFANISDAIWVHDMSGTITFANKACENLTGRPVSELINKNVRDFMTLEALTLARQVKDRLLRGEAVEQRYEQRLVKKQSCN
jgi:PAS domain-containing protein